MTGIELVNTAIFVGAALVLLGIFSSLIATRFGAPLLLVFLVVGMLAGQDGPGGIVFNDYQATYLVGSIALSVILFDGGLRTRLSAFRGILAPSLLLATVGRADHRRGGGRGRLGGARPRSDGRAAARRHHRLDRRGGGVLPAAHRRPPAAAPGRRDARDRVRHQRPDRGLPRHRADRVHPGAAAAWPAWTSRSGSAWRRWSARSSASRAASALVAILNRVAMPGGLHPLFAVAGAILIAAFTTSSAAAACSPSTSPGSCWRTGRRGPIPRSSASTTPSPGSARS